MIVSSLDSSASDEGPEASADTIPDQPYFDGPYGGEPNAIGRCWNEDWRSRQGRDTGNVCVPFSLRRCDAAGTYYAFYGREFCDARATLVLAFDQTDTNINEAVLPELRTRIIDAYRTTARVLVVSIAATSARPAPTVFGCAEWARRYSLTGGMFVDEGGVLRGFAPPMTLAAPLAIIVDRNGVIRWKQARDLTADVIRRELDAVLAGQ